MPGSREPTHVSADLREDCGRGDCSDARDRLQQLERFFERRQAALDLYLHLSNGLLQEIDVRQELAEQHQVMRLDSSVERLAQLGQLGPQDSTGQLGEDARIPLAIEHCCQRGPAAHA